MTVNTMDNLNSWFKVSYADRIVDLTPDNVIFAKEIPDVPADQQPGGTYTQPVTLTSEQGITLAGASAGAFALNSPEAMSTANATINGGQFLLRSALDYETIMRSQSKNSFINSTKGVIKNMLKSSWFYQEAEIMWGKAGLATISAVSTNALTITTAEFASGLWLGSENRKLRIETSAGVLRGTCSVSSYNIGTRVVNVDAAPAGTASTDVIYFESAGASGANEMQGIYGIVGTVTGLMFGVNASNYNLWAPAANFSAGSAPLTYNKIMLAIANCVNKGLGDEIRDIEVYVNPLTFQNVGNDLSTLKTTDSSYSTKTAENGSEAISFTCQAGHVAVRPHRLMKEGYAFVMPKASRSFEKVGCQSTPTFNLPGSMGNGKQEYLRTMENSAGVEARIAWNTSVITQHRGQMCLISGIVNATS